MAPHSTAKALRKLNTLKKIYSPYNKRQQEQKKEKKNVRNFVETRYWKDALVSRKIRMGLGDIPQVPWGLPPQDSNYLRFSVYFEKKIGKVASQK